MIELVYVSSATERFDADQLSALLSKARSNNTKSNITGLLLYDGFGTFMQVLEGDESDLTPLLEKIRRDNRHKRVNILWQGEISQRGFPDWKMGFHQMQDLPSDKIEGFSDFLDIDCKDEHLASHKGFASEMLGYFKSKYNERAVDDAR